MENIVKTTLFTLIVSLGLTPCFAGHPPPVKEKSFLANHKKKLLAAGASAVLAPLVYYAAKNRSIASEPTPADIRSFGTKAGQSILFSHGFSHFWGGFSYYFSRPDRASLRYILDPTRHDITTFNYPEGLVGRTKPLSLSHFFKLKYDQVSLGQENDLKRLAEVVAQIEQPNTIAIGASRGASIYLNFMGTTKSKKITALILDSPYATLEEAFRFRISQARAFYIGKIPFFAKICHALAQALFPQYDPYGLQPIDVIDKIDKNIPIMLVHSKVDTTISIDESRRLYLKRKKQGCDNVYLVELEQGRHARGLHGPCGDVFQNAVHTFYKKHGYDYTPEFADKVNLENYQPSIEEVEQRLG